jgi:hypothetical protein
MVLVTRRFAGWRPLSAKGHRARPDFADIDFTQGGIRNVNRPAGSDMRAEVGRHEEPSVQSPQKISAGTKTKSGT